MMMQCVWNYNSRYCYTPLAQTQTESSSDDDRGSSQLDECVVAELNRSDADGTASDTVIRTVEVGKGLIVVFAAEPVDSGAWVSMSPSDTVELGRCEEAVDFCTKKA